MKPEDNPLISPDFFCGIMWNFDQFGVNYKNNRLYGIESLRNGIGKVTKIDKLTEYKVEQPINILKLKKTEVPKLEKIIEDIATHKYPNPIQLSNLNILPESADTVKTQAILMFCVEWFKSYGCNKCPMFRSELGCPDYLELDVSPQYISNNGNRYIHIANNLLWSKRSFSTFAHALRQYISWDKYKKISERIKEKQEVDEISLGQFGEAGE